jgi:thermostable 8-oxoguanine DNA glycosylase
MNVSLGPEAAFCTRSGEVRRLILPAAGEEVIPGIPWGRPEEIFTPAYWRAQVWFDSQLGSPTRFSIGRTLAEEIAACLLGGYGIPAETGLASFYRLRDSGLLEEIESTSLPKIEDALREPLEIGGRTVAYRFPAQRAKYIVSALSHLPNLLLDHRSTRAQRDLLCTLPGIGYKTASWIARNHWGADDVAILDVHVLRAGRLIGLFSESEHPSRHYRAMEERFLLFATRLDVRPSVLDAVIWHQMRQSTGWTRSLKPFWQTSGEC